MLARAYSLPYVSLILIFFTIFFCYTCRMYKDKLKPIARDVYELARSCAEREGERITPFMRRLLQAYLDRRVMVVDSTTFDLFYGFHADRVEGIARQVAREEVRHVLYKEGFISDPNER